MKLRQRTLALLTAEAITVTKRLNQVAEAVNALASLEQPTVRAQIQLTIEKEILETLHAQQTSLRAEITRMILE